MITVHEFVAMLGTMGVAAMLKWLNPLNLIKAYVKSKLKEEVKIYGDGLRDQVLEALKAKSTEDEVNAFFDKEEAAIMATIDSF